MHLIQNKLTDFICRQIWLVTVLVPVVIGQLYIRSPGDRGPIIRQYALGKCVMTDLSPVPVNTGGYKIEIVDKPEKYSPGENYRIILRGDQKFTGFALLVNLKSSKDSSFDTSSFQLFRDALSKFSDGCSNAVVHTSTIPKSDIQVMYRAPPAGTGCIVFKAAAQDISGIWHTGQNGLVKEICEADQETTMNHPDTLEECCACSEAEYDVTFEGLWSKQTHPKDFPKNDWFTHFSDIIGASHARDFIVFQEGGLATDGVRQAATTGFTRKLENDLKSQPSKVKTIIKASGLWFPNLNGRTSASFSVNKDHPALSILSMLGPSPDWIVGLSGLNLCEKNCTWTSLHAIDLFLYDAGVANGVKYQGDNSPTVPQEPIRQITSSDPDTDESPFYDPSGEPLKPFARLHVRRQTVKEQSCEARPDEPNGSTSKDPVFKVPEGEDRPECAVTDWTDWTPCSATCGKGIQMRMKQYVNPQKADMFQCTATLIEKQMCEAQCVGNVSCQTTDWTDWSDCSVICGKGTRTRSRRYYDSKARKLCKLDLVEREPCMGMKAVCDPRAAPDHCAVTPWSDWSPCTVTCGKGLKIRTRLYMNPHNSGTCTVELMQNEPCMAEKPDCTVDMMEAKHICVLPKLVGPCRGYFPRWFYDTKRKICSQFVYGGCRGNRNNFERYSECQATCDAVFKDMPIESLPVTDQDPDTEENDVRIMVPKIMSPDDVPHMRKIMPRADDISQARKVMTSEDLLHLRNIMTSRTDGRFNPRRTPESQPGMTSEDFSHQPRKTMGRGFNDDLSQQPRKVMTSGGVSRLRNFMSGINDDLITPQKFMPNNFQGADLSQLVAVVDCMATEWSDWSPCSQTCGNSKKERRRMVKQLPQNGGKPCPSRLVQRRRCNLDPCP